MSDQTPTIKADKASSCLKTIAYIASILGVILLGRFAISELLAALAYGSAGIMPVFWFYLSSFIVLVVFIVLAVIRSVRIKNVKPSSSPPSDLKIETNLLLPGEKIVSYIGGVTFNGWGNYGTSVLGTGTYNFPENALLLTNNNIILIYVPFDYGDKYVNDESMHEIQHVYMQKQIDEKLESILASESLESIVTNYARLILPLAQTQVSFKPKVLGIFQPIAVHFLYNEKKYSYATLNQEKYDKLRDMFKNYVITP